MGQQGPGGDQPQGYGQQPQGYGQPPPSGGMSGGTKAVLALLAGVLILVGR